LIKEYIILTIVGYFLSEVYHRLSRRSAELVEIDKELEHIRQNHLIHLTTFSFELQKRDQTIEALAARIDEALTKDVDNIPKS